MLNGFLVTRINLPPFIVTLGTLSIFLAAGLLYSGGSNIQSDAMPPIAERGRQRPPHRAAQHHLA